MFIHAVKTHLNCASLLHEYALRFKRSCRDLITVDSLKKVSYIYAGRKKEHF